MFKKIIFVVSCLLATSFALVEAAPRLDRDWVNDQKVLANFSFKGNKVTIENIRNILYRTTEDFDVRFYNQTFNLDEIESIWYMVEDIGKFQAAHTLVSFGFKDGSYVAISIEIRREQGEEFSAFKGMFGKFELTYVIASESDVIKLRTNYRKNLVRLFPLRIEGEALKNIFVDMLVRAENIATTPEFYNTLTNNCTTNLIDHFRKFQDKDLPAFHLNYLLAQYSDKVFYKAGLLDTELSLEEARQYFNITERAQRCAEDENFSLCIRR